MTQCRLNVSIAGMVVILAIIGTVYLLPKKQWAAKPYPIPVMTMAEAEQSGGIVSVPTSTKRGPIEYVCNDVLPPDSIAYARSLSAVMTAAMNHWHTKSVTVTVAVAKGRDGRQHTVFLASLPGTMAL